ncbi:hypothetical protein [Marinobacter sp. F3R08]|uniref:ribosome modulation factor n=1 Tax=Marinobacter sp. F3R08 TaxID=2841559 RepID=UPI001C08D042|nr:hypothetical protein [Marinobacter sp. F3R08]MBU2952264.1 hypothetical protein [Marinobacter sp. F3R08]
MGVSETEYIEGAVTFQEGYAAGVKGADAGDNPYPEGFWLAESWMLGWQEGDLERKARDEPIMTFPA